MKLIIKTWMILASLQFLNACNDIGISGFDKDEPEQKVNTFDPNSPSKPLGTIDQDDALAVDPSYSSFQLVEFDSCANIETHLRGIALSQLELEKEWEIDHTTRLHNGEDDWIYAEELIIEDAAVARNSSETMSAESASAGADAGEAQSGPANHTGTNNQVKGVEEADFIKNTGTHMFQIHGNKVRISKTWPADSMSLEASIELKAEPYKLLLSDKRLIVLSHPIYDQEYYGKPEGSFNEPDIGRPMPDIAIEPFPGGPSQYIHYDHQRTQVTIYDVSTITSPSLVKTYELAGQVREARRVGNLVRLVSTSYGYHTIPQMTWLRWDTKRDQLIPLETKLAAIDSNFEKNKAKIEQMSLSDFIKTRQLTRVTGTAAAEEISNETCQKIFSVNANVAYGLTNVVSIDAETGDMDESLLLAAVDTLYMNEKSLYLVTPYYTQRDENMSKNTSFVHKFSLEAGLASDYQGSGEVDGNPLNQFSLDEHKDILRIATTVTERSKKDDRFGFEPGKTYNIISTMAASEGSLKVLGRTENLAETERIYSVRYHGDWAYVVTFRQVDPLFTINLENPEAPKKVGELKIPGYSSYMQMLDDNHILAVGRDGTEQGRILGLKVSIFDVTDKANPSEAATFTVSDEMWSSSDAEWDHKAITYDYATKTLALPISRRYWSRVEPLIIEGDVVEQTVIEESFSSALYMFTIANDSITEKGVLKAKHAASSSANPWWYYDANTVRRSVIADNFVYAISNTGIISASMDNLTSPLQVLTYPKD